MPKNAVRFVGPLLIALYVGSVLGSGLVCAGFDSSDVASPAGMPESPYVQQGKTATSSAILQFFGFFELRDTSTVAIGAEHRLVHRSAGRAAPSQSLRSQSVLLQI